jgi:hypothetical protein
MAEVAALEATSRQASTDAASHPVQVGVKAFFEP